MSEDNKLVVGNVTFNPNGILDQSKIPVIPGSVSSINQGWQCPACKWVYAPHVHSCTNCNKPDFRGTAG